MHRSASVAASFASPRAWSYVLLGLSEHDQLGCSESESLQGELLDRLAGLFERVSTPDWPWLEDVVTYDNARIAEALIRSGTTRDHERGVGLGLRSLEWLDRVQTVAGVFSPIGNAGWYPRGGRPARFDQQPLEAHGMADACRAALGATGDARWHAIADRALGWFEGDNLVGAPVADLAGGGCHDGLTPHGTNRNMGAESTLAWLGAQLVARELAPMAAGRGHLTENCAEDDS
jgi:hypothetical protein